MNLVIPAWKWGMWISGSSRQIEAASVKNIVNGAVKTDCPFLGAEIFVQIEHNLL